MEAIPDNYRICRVLGSDLIVTFNGIVYNITQAYTGQPGLPKGEYNLFDIRESAGENDDLALETDEHGDVVGITFSPYVFILFTYQYVAEEDFR